MNIKNILIAGGGMMGKNIAFVFTSNPDYQISVYDLYPTDVPGGIRRMLEEDAYCIDIINQVAAANAALNSFTKVLLANHIHTCVTEDVQAGSSEKVDELVKTLQKLMK